MKRAKELRASAWEHKKGQWGLLAVIWFLYGVIFAVIGSFSALAIIPVIGAIIAFIAGVAVFLINGPFTLGLSNVALEVSEGKHTSLNRLFSGFKDFGAAFILQLLISIFTFLWSLLFVIPGIIKAYSYSMSFFVLADHPELSAGEARKRSMYLMQGRKWKLFCLDFSFIGWYLLSILTFGILSFWVMPYYMTARAEFYQELLREEQAAANPMSAPIASN